MNIAFSVFETTGSLFLVNEYQNNDVTKTTTLREIPFFFCL